MFLPRRSRLDKLTACWKHIRISIANILLTGCQSVQTASLTNNRGSKWRRVRSSENAPFLDSCSKCNGTAKNRRAQPKRCASRKRAVCKSRKDFRRTFLAGLRPHIPHAIEPYAIRYLRGSAGRRTGWTTTQGCHKECFQVRACAIRSRTVEGQKGHVQLPRYQFNEGTHDSKCVKQGGMFLFIQDGQ
jgi:hypothetical protein